MTVDVERALRRLRHLHQVHQNRPYGTDCWTIPELLEDVEAIAAIAIEARSGETGTGSTEGKSAAIAQERQ